MTCRSGQKFQGNSDLYLGKTISDFSGQVCGLAGRSLGIYKQMHAELRTYLLIISSICKCIQCKNICEVVGFCFQGRGKPSMFPSLQLHEFNLTIIPSFRPQCSQSCFISHFNPYQILCHPIFTYITFRRHSIRKQRGYFKYIQML